ncbi:MAG: hypothetical protein JRH20_13130 [Deltaproteobacteria bacterium]|nr:hypothetical protein [Deltaproteobacteria bacterium]
MDDQIADSKSDQRSELVDLPMDLEPDFDGISDAPAFVDVVDASVDATSADTASLDAPLVQETRWLGGANVRGVFNSISSPGARYYSATFGTDELWLYGGIGLDASGSQVTLADLWRYNIGGGWVHLSGPLTGALQGNWGERGVEAASNTPGSRGSALFASDHDGALWLYGGSGIDALGVSGQLADLWRYSPQSGQWTWVAGRNTVGLAPSFGVQGMPDNSSLPGQRADGALWVDGDGHVWIFAGTEPGYFNWRNDLWSYDPVGDLWTWHGGYIDTPSYGTQGVEAASNWPGRRFDFGYTQASDGSVWIFGGEGNAEVGEWALGGLWRFRKSSGQWTFISGSKTVGSEGVYLSLGSPDPTGVPCGRISARLAADPAGVLWLFGGFGRISGGDHSLNDLWRYEPLTGLWSWMAGSNGGDQPGVYDFPGGWPGARDGHGLMMVEGQLLLFGGSGLDSDNTWGKLNDLWVIAR